MSVARWQARGEGLVVSELDGETLVYDLRSHQAHCLNGTAAAVWRECDGETTPAQIAAQLGYEEEVVWLALDKLWRLGLVDGEAAPGPKPTLSRGRLLKTALVALPLAATIAAPSAAQVATCGGLGAPCLTNEDCCSGLICIFQVRSGPSPDQPPVGSCGEP